MINAKLEIKLTNLDKEIAQSKNPAAINNGVFL
jgi:hypothetical protein